MTEQFANFAQSTLSSAINAAQTTISVASATSFPLLGNFRIVVQSFDANNISISQPELMIVTAVAGNNFTVTRGAESTTALAFASGARVTHILTAAVMYNLGGGSGVSSLNGLIGGLNLTSSDASVNITPSGTSINLQAASGGLSAIGAYSVLANNTGVSAIPTGQQTLNLGLLGYTDTGIIESLASTTAGYSQSIIQNKSNAANASANFIVSNDAGTATTNFGEMGINSSTFTGTGSFNIPGAVYIDSANDMVIGTLNNNTLHFVANSGATDAASVSGAGVFTINSLTATNTITGSVSGNAATATALQTARNINGVSFSGTADITVTAAAGTLTGATLNATVINSSLTSVGTLANLTVTNPISGSITGNAGTVTTNANLTGVIISVGNATSIASQTGTGTKFVVDTSPTLITPNIGTATGTGLVITSTSATTGLACGPTGTSNPVFNVDSSVASVATGISVIGNAAAAGVFISVLSSGTNENIEIRSKGTGNVILRRGTTALLNVGQSSCTISTNASLTTATTVRFSVTSGSDTGITAGAEAPHTYFNLNTTRQHASNTAITLQRDFRITGSDHSFASATGTLTDQAAFSVDLSTSASTNASVTNIHNIYIPSVVLTGTKTNSFGLTINANSGATNNYAANLNGVCRLAAVTALSTKVEGDFWNDSTQKCQTYYSDGVVQYASTTLFAQTATATVANTTTPTTLFSTGIGTLTLPANFWIAGKTISINMGGVFSTFTVPGNVTIAVKLGSVTIATGTITNILASATNNAFMGFLDITCRTTGATGTVMCNGNVNYDTGTLARGFLALNNSGATATIDTTASQAIDVQITWATANAANTISATTARVEVLS